MINFLTHVTTAKINFLAPCHHFLTHVTTAVVNLLISSLVSLGAENHFDVHLPILALADLVPGDLDLEDGDENGDENGNDGEDDDGNNDVNGDENDDGGDDDDGPVFLASCLTK